MTDRPTTPHIALYGPDTAEQEADGRLHSPTFPRNSPPMIAALAPWMAGRTGPVLEIGAGTGQHAAAFSLAFPDVDWWPSDPVPAHRRSIAAWAAQLGAPGLRPLDLDAAGDWPRQREIGELGALTAVLSMNVIHIAAFGVAEGIVRGSGQTLRPGGLLIFYGPFFVAGDPVSSGNTVFDKRLRADNPEWGIRDTDQITELATQANLRFAALQPMPANNRLLIFRKTE